MTGLVLLSVLAAGDVGAAREDARLHAGLGVVVAGGVTPYSFGFGPGLNAELGVVLGDRSVLSARLNFGTTTVLAAGTLGVAYDFVISDRWSVGVGAALGLIGGAFGIPYSVSAQVPLRAQYAFTTRGETETARRGLVLFVELSPGLTLLGLPGKVRALMEPPVETVFRFAGFGVIGVSYAWF